ncbi:MAG: bifunctional biotin--[acetyl-CoA-carboxylase] ligase/biotin operon repressor BirA [Gammaproteobacteria bacterium]|jgi:BirA family biotin operon repressor/biotin-[acetyl-CoA-carboxylase] ligase
MSLTFRILEQLADGKFHSGEALATQFDISRARVWQAVDELRGLGLEIAAVTGRGYKIFDGLELLNEQQIKSHLPEDLALNTEFIMCEHTGSTNSVLSEQLRQNKIASGTVCLAEYQSLGRGRLGRTWVSPISSNIYCSIAWQFKQSASQLMGLSLVTGLAVIEALQQIGAKNIGLKWPNDIFYQGKKLGGILVEIAGDALGPCDVVIGIGLNVNMPRHIKIDQAFTDLSQIMQRRVSRNQLIAHMITSLNQYLPRFSEYGFNGFINEWLKYDILHNQPVKITQLDQILDGFAIGIDEQGQLKVKIGDKEQRLTSAEVSVSL